MILVSWKVRPSLRFVPPPLSLSLSLASLGISFSFLFACWSPFLLSSSAFQSFTSAFRLSCWDLLCAAFSSSSRYNTLCFKVATERLLCCCCSGVVSGLAVLRSNVECILSFTNDPPISLLFLSLYLCFG